MKDNPYVRAELEKARHLYEQRMHSPIVHKARRAYYLTLVFVILVIVSACLYLFVNAG